MTEPASQQARAEGLDYRRRAALQRSFRMLAEVLGGSAEQYFADQPLANVLSRASAQLGHRLPLHLDYSLESHDLKAVLAGAGFVVREVDPPANWRQQDLGVLLIDDENKGFFSALPGSGGYRVADASGTVSESAFANARFYALYPQLPTGRLGLRDLARAYMRQVRPELLLFAPASLLVALVAGAVPALTGLIVNSVVPDHDRALLYQLSLLLLFVVSAQSALEFFISWIRLRMETRSGLAMRAAFMQRILNLADKTPLPPTSLALQLQFADALINGLSTAALRLFSGGLLLMSATALMVWYQPIAGMVTLAVTLVLLAAVFIVGWLRVRILADSQQIDVNSSAKLYDILCNLSLLRACGLEPVLLSQWARSYAAMRSRLMASKLLATAVPALQSAWPLLLMLAGYGAAALAGIAPSGQGDFIAFTTAMATLMLALMQLTVASEELFQALPMKQSMQTLLDFEAPRAMPGLVPSLSGEVEVVDLSHTYPGQPNPALHNISLHISSGEYVGIVGASGSGKSTLLRCMIGLEDHETGLVMYDGQSLGRIDPVALRRQLALVLQGQPLMPGSLYDNICLFSPLPMAKVWEAAEAADIAELIRTLPMGMFTMVGDSDPVFSGGQVQRVLLARAIALNSPILMLDEATSALDENAQARVSSHLRELSVTRIVVAHRLSTVRHCDRIVVMDRGEIVQTGRWQDLEQADGIFKTLLQSQSGVERGDSHE